ncbi:bifunctional [glutamate--ammonia ligase]-adenylyl-L-tyrosine phosphorylase/[glutamate--ammonia-ligase] adenylyltransferase [Alteromonas pelagimontana]|uniref:Bifunctional glutamine synthetase adenylyltransferase/adenylyl-removing enzyme n=1 Tax=Alteromonas pelagimontana TaxID=1858656 RepID=A0A6N3IY18_9ALTE|nr:bifunctional [glutamate--ammonia ligase]-adenylyl-L-tyrosine phosphorylase/[glutamate--ammonia-ligase] adenylyltransferase [Alteromonas pelagimontana]
MPTQKIKNRIIEEHAQQYWLRFQEACAAHPQLLDLQDKIKPLFGLSEFITEQCLRHPQWAVDICDALSAAPDKVSDYAANLDDALANVKNEDELLAALRQYRHREMAIIAALDLMNYQTIEVSLKKVSALADALILGAYNWLYSHLSSQYGTPEGSFGAQPMLMLAMGKLGGGELNFSSDIDLIFAYPEKGETSGARKPMENQKFFTRLAQKLIAALNKITVDGQVFRVDMRLRPFGDSGPLVMHLSAFEDYYQEQGRHWERFAMVKARILNPADNYCDQLADILKPFTFRRYLDFTTLDALRNMKQLIASEIRRRQLANNIKLGAGGIREVEFFAQSFQLIHGGREPQLQCKGLHTSLQALDDLGVVDSQTLTALYEDYLFLRKTEHTLQQCRDQQTQSLPDDYWGQAVVAHVAECENYDAFMAKIDAAMHRIHVQFNDLVEETQDSHGDDDSLFSKCADAWRLRLSQNEFAALFENQLPAQTAEDVCAQLENFRGHLRGYRIGQRGEDTLQKLMPELLYVLVSEKPQHAGRVLARTLGVINAITGRTTYLDLLLENPDVLRQLVKLCDRSEWIAHQIQRFPLLLDELLTPLYLQQQETDIIESKSQYADELRQSLLRIDEEDAELMMDAMRQFKLCQQLRIAASDISGSLPIAKVSDKLTVLAEVLLDTCIHSAWQQVKTKFGEPEHLEAGSTGFAVIGYGKLGGYELGYGSDLDLVFLHNAPKESQTNGKRTISAQQFYIKLAQRIMHLLNTKTLFGQLFETDLRLRPSGNAGLLSCHVEGFLRYQREDAWTWEHQALVRARGISGDTAVLEEFRRIRNAILCQRRDRDTLNNDVKTMRKKMRDHLLQNSQQGVDIKQCEGGIADIEFLTQYWVLAHAHEHASLTTYTDNLRILDGIKALQLFDATQCARLQEAYLRLRDHYHQLTLADDKYAEETQDLQSMRAQVSTVWNAVFMA